MGEDINNFLRYLFLVVSITMLTQTVEHYLKIDWAKEYAWVGGIFFAFMFYQMSKSK